uniref:Retrovirus-related Pol polyprotein from transposon TNT 1-94-like beta-barrel domain-containing protein n=1 Tax=Cajanus cajan TaxID=3821 RepID=A0A151RXS8_CAJCA|nr:hypothetical protein KK1_031035 [Cajanus cajan]
MTGTLENLWESRALDGCLVGLQNGELVLANKEGSIFLDGGLKLENVLYVLKLNCNLISVSQLIDEAKCKVHFTDRFCAMQDHTSRTLIGAGERKDGLYWYRDVWIYLLNNKKDVSQTLMNFIALIERQYEKQVKVIRSENGTEFMCLQ